MTQNTSKNYPISVYLKKEDREYMESLAEQLGVSRHSVLQFGIEYFIQEHKDGKIQIPTKTKTVTEIKQSSHLGELLPMLKGIKRFLNGK